MKGVKIFGNALFWLKGLTFALNPRLAKKGIKEQYLSDSCLQTAVEHRE
jgi:hypothetical protein